MKKIILLSLIFFLFSCSSSEIDKLSEELKQVKKENIELKKQSEKDINVLKKEFQDFKEKNTEISANFGYTGALTTKGTLDIDLKLKNITELFINEKIIDIKGKDSIKYSFNLELGDNEIIIIGKGNNIIRKIKHNIKRISEEEYQKIEKEKKDKIELEKLAEIEKEKSEKLEAGRIEKERIAKEKLKKEEELQKIKEKEEASKLGISYNQVLKNMSHFSMKRGADITIGGDNIVGKKNYTGQNNNLNMLLQIIGDKNNISTASLTLFGSKPEQFTPLLIFIRNMLPGEIPLNVTGDLFDSLELNGSNNYEKVYGNKLFKYAKKNVGGVIVQIYKVTSVN